MTRFLHTGDWQLGMTRHFFEPGPQDRFNEARRDVVRRIAAVARDENCAFVVVAGDVFETNHVARQTVAQAVDALREFTMPVLLLPGNHDPLDAASVLGSADLPDSVRVVADTTPIEVVPGVEVIGVPWHSKRPAGDEVSDVCAHLAPASGVTRILLAHGATQGYGDADAIGRIDMEAVDAALASGALHYVALGDHHNLAAPRERVRYAGAPEPTAFRETDPGHVLVVDIDGDACAATPHKVGTWRFVSRDVELDSDASLDEFEESLDAEPDKGRIALRLAVRGHLTLAQHSRYEDMLERASDLYASVQLWARHTDLAVVPADSDFADLAVAGFARAALERLRKLAEGDGDAAAHAKRALALMTRLVGAPQ